MQGISAPLFLNDEELRELTGYKLFSCQIKWLKRNGWRFEVAASGRPIVLRRYAEAHLSGTEKATESWTPNLAAMKRVA